MEKMEKHVYQFTGTFAGEDWEIEITELASLIAVTYFVRILSPAQFCRDNGLYFPLAMTYYPALDEFHNDLLNRFPELSDFICHKITSIHA